MYNEKYMRRAIELARKGKWHASPNPMVGAVIVHEDRIIGEGYHRRCGEGHAEVNAIASVREEDRHLLGESTMYVTLEPCAHYGKTPPCSKLIIDKGIKSVVVGCADPFAKVAGRGIAMLREAGVDVTVGVLEDECRRLNRVFMTAHTLKRPFVTLKWAQTADGYMDADRNENEASLKISGPLTQLMTHRLRSLHDAILTTAATVNADNPRLTVRDWEAGDAPLRVIIDRSGALDNSKALASEPDVAVYNREIAEVLTELYQQGISSVLVEGGPRILKALISGNLWDMAVVETSSTTVGNRGRAKTPDLPGRIVATEFYPDSRRDICVAKSLSDI